MRNTRLALLLLLLSKGLGASQVSYIGTGASAGDVVGPASSVNSEIALFSGTTGKLLKSATGTGIVTATSGVYGTVALGAANRVLGVNSAGTANEYKDVTGTANQITINHSANTINVAAAQNISSVSSPTFAGTSLNGVADATELGILMFAGQTAYPFQIYTSGFSDLAHITAAGNMLIQDVTGAAFRGTSFTGSTAASSATGVFRLGNGESVGWRNAANSGDETILVNGSDEFQFSKAILLPGNPTLALEAAPKQYVDALASALTVKSAVQFASTTAFTATYLNGASGVGATLTNTGSLVAFSIDGGSPSAGARVLIKNQASALQNGCYNVTTVGSGVVAWVLTRCTDWDQAAEMAEGDSFYVSEGTVNGVTAWILTTNTAITVGVTSLNFAETIAASQTVTLTGDVTASGQTGTSITTAIGSGVIVNADVNASAAIDYSKLAAMTGDVTMSANASAIGTNKVANTQLAQMATATFKGRTTAGTGNAEDLTATQATALLNAMVGDSGSGGTKGLVSAPASGDAAAGKFWKADATWAAPPTAKTWSSEATNYTLTATVGSSALTIALKDNAGSDPSGTTCFGFRNATIATGTYAQQCSSAATSLVISSGSTLGQTSAVAEYIYVYAIYSGSAVVLGASTSPQFGINSVASGVAEGGAGAADTRTVLYTAATQTSKAVQLIGRLQVTEATAGTWATAPADIKLLPLDSVGAGEPFFARNGSVKKGIGEYNCDASATTKQNPDSMSTAIGNIGTPTGGCNITVATGYFSATPLCVATISQEQGGTSTNTRVGAVIPQSATSVYVDCSLDTGASCTDFDIFVECTGAP